jgi:hypothetical protein
MSAFRALDDIAPLPIWTGILARVVEGAEMTFAVVELDPHAVALLHQHTNEQIGNVLHEATAGPDGAAVIDVFAPIRADWHRFTAKAPQPALWP